MLGLVDELNEKLKDLRERIDPMKKALEKVAPFLPLRASSQPSPQISTLAPVEDELVKYLEVKQQILLSYCINIIFYLMLKAEGASVQSHPVMKQLLKLRFPSSILSASPHPSFPPSSVPQIHHGANETSRREDEASDRSIVKRC
jgi:hypothetical protein